MKSLMSSVSILMLLLLASCETSPDDSDTSPDTTASAPDTLTVSQGSLTKARNLRHPITSGSVTTLYRYWGLERPIEMVTQSLMDHPEVIPLEGVLGGTMDFWGERHIFVLDTKWVYAYFEDGHTGGYGIFEYTIHDNRDITWELVAWHQL